jgi:hypothetical protein
VDKFARVGRESTKGNVEVMPISNRYENAQRKMLKAFDDYLPTKGSGKFHGDVSCRILKAFLTKELGLAFKVSEPNAYILGDTREFDLLILAGNAKPNRYTNAFDPKSVKCAIEVKAKGTGYSSNPRQDVQKLKCVFEEIKKKHGVCPVYFTFQETTPRDAKAIHYWVITRDGLIPFSAFCLRNVRGSEIEEGEWQRFVEYLHGVLQA